MVKFIVLLQNADIEEHEVPLSSKDKSKPISTLFRFKKNREPFLEKTKKLGKGKFEQFKITMDKNTNLFIFGFLKGSKPNTHELPCLQSLVKDKPSFFDDIILIKTNNNDIIVDINAKEYEKLYESHFSDPHNETFESDESSSEIKNDGDESDFDENVNEDDENVNEDDDEIEIIDDIDDDSENEDCNDCNDSDIEETNIYSDNDEDIDDIEIDTLEIAGKTNIYEIKYDEKQISQNNKTREFVINLLDSIIKVKEISIKIEKSILDYTISMSINRQNIIDWNDKQFVQLYLNKSRSLVANIKKDSYIKNTMFLEKIKENKFDVEKLASLNCQEIFPEHWKNFLDEKYKKEKLMYEDDVQANTDMFKCGRCKQNKCTYYELQTRSADEGMTTFITCLTCGNRWKQ